MEEPIIITAAVTAFLPTQKMNPATPCSPEKIADAAVECDRAGVAIARIPGRNPETGATALDKDLCRRVLERIREKSKIIANLSTNGLWPTGPDVSDQAAPGTHFPETGHVFPGPVVNGFSEAERRSEVH